MKFLKHRKLSLNFKIIFIIALILTISLTIAFYIMGKRYERLLYSQTVSQARILFQQILITRKWIANHGGIFVEQTPQVKPDPFLENPVITDKVGKRYIKENPASITRELSKYAQKEGIFWYHITSLKLVNPANAPDEFERNSLERFEREGNLRELYKIKKIDDHNFLKYIAPLYVEKACMKCHAKHGYKVGDIRGAISVTIPVDNVFELIKSNKRNTIIATYVISAIIILFLFFTMNLIVIRPVKKLTGYIKDYGKKKYHSEDVIKSGDEIEDLSKAFAKMADELSMYHDSLDYKVKEATRNLQDMNNKLVEANKKLEDMYRKKSDFVASVSHEMRTPLTSIKGSMEYIFEKIKKVKSEDKKLDDIKEFIEIIKKQADRLIKTVNDTIDLERIELLGKVEMHISPIDLTYLIHETTKGFRTILSEKNLKINIHSEDEMIVCVDEDRIRQVLINLIHNAINFSPHNGIIEINSFRENGWIVAEIMDNGPGIEDAERKQIFKKYYKKGTHDGSGIGLAICKGIIEAHGGEIGIKDERTEGTTFYFKIPLVEKKKNEEDTCR